MIDQAGLEMFAACVEANVRETQRATETVFDNYERQIAELRRDFTEFYWAVFEASEGTTTRRLESVLAAFGPAYSDAREALRRKEGAS